MSPGPTASFGEIVQLLLHSGFFFQGLNLAVAVFDVGDTVFVATRDIDTGGPVFLDVFPDLGNLLIDRRDLVKKGLRAAAPVLFAVRGVIFVAV